MRMRGAQGLSPVLVWLLVCLLGMLQTYRCVENLHLYLLFACPMRRNAGRRRSGRQSPHGCPMKGALLLGMAFVWSLAGDHEGKQTHPWSHSQKMKKRRRHGGKPSCYHVLQQ